MPKKKVALNSAKISPFCKLIKFLSSISEFLKILKYLAKVVYQGFYVKGFLLLVYTFNHLRPYHTGVTFLKKTWD